MAPCAPMAGGALMANVPPALASNTHFQRVTLTVAEPLPVLPALSVPCTLTAIVPRKVLKGGSQSFNCATPQNPASQAPVEGVTATAGATPPSVPCNAA